MGPQASGNGTRLALHFPVRSVLPVPALTFELLSLATRSCRSEPRTTRSFPEKLPSKQAFPTCIHVICLGGVNIFAFIKLNYWLEIFIPAQCNALAFWFYYSLFPIFVSCSKFVKCALFYIQVIDKMLSRYKYRALWHTSRDLHLKSALYSNI